MRLEPRVPPWGSPSSLRHNSQIPRSTSTRFLKYKFPKYKFSTDKYVQAPFQASEVLQPYFKASKGISRTSLRCGVFTRFAIEIFFLRFAQLKKAKDSYWWATYEGNFHVSSTKNSFFWFTSSGVHKQPILFEVLAPAFFILRGSHVQRQYQKRTTLHSRSSTIKGLLYAPEPHNRKKGTLSDQPRLLRVSSMALLCCWEPGCSKIWRPLWLTLRRMPYGRGTLKIPLRRILLRGRPALSLWVKRKEAVIRLATINLFTSLDIPLVIPYPGCTA